MQSQYFQREFIEEIVSLVNNSSESYLNSYLETIRSEVQDGDFARQWLLAFEDHRLDGKVLFIRQWLDLKQSNNENTERSVHFNILQNLKFLQKLRRELYLWQEEVEDELYDFRFYFMCKTLEKENQATTRYKVRLMPINEFSVVEALKKFNLLANHTIIIDTNRFGIDLYERVQSEATSILNDFLLFIKHSLEEIILDEESLNNQEFPFKPSSNSRKLLRIIRDIENVLRDDHDLYRKRQFIYQYIQENRTASEENNQLIQTIDNEGADDPLANNDFIGQIFSKLQKKGLQFMRIFLFSNFEFLELLHRYWLQLLPQAPLPFFYQKDLDTNDGLNSVSEGDFDRIASRLLREVQLRYEDFRRDFVDGDIYYKYLEKVRELSELSARHGKDPTHIFEMMYSASQNVATLREDIMVAKCREMLMLMK